MNSVKSNLFLISIWSKKRWEWAIVIFSCSFFLLLKIWLLIPRFGDGFEYLYMAKILWMGVLPYRDYLLVDPPLLELLFSPLMVLVGDQWRLLQLLPAIAEIVTAVVLFLLCKKEKIIFAWLAPLLYLFSFTVLATSDYLTGVHITNSLILLGIFFRDRPMAAGFSWGLALTTKLYSIPSLTGQIFELLLEKRLKQALALILISAVVASLVVVPFIIQAPEKSFQQLIIHHLDRTTGIPSISIWTYFLQREWFLIAFGLLGVILWKKLRFTLSFLFTFLFLLIFHDLYYAYLDLLLPFLVFFTLAGLTTLRLIPTLSPHVFPVFFTLLGFSLVISGGYYFNVVIKEGVFLSFKRVVEEVSQLEKKPLYGSHELVPQIALALDWPILDHISETNAQAFTSGALDLEGTSLHVATSDAYLIARVADYPELGVTDQGFEGYFSRRVFDERCRRLQLIPDDPAQTLNAIGIYECR